MTTGLMTGGLLSINTCIHTHSIITARPPNQITRQSKVKKSVKYMSDIY